MIVKIFSAGKSFRGLGKYITHDAGADTAERVAWTHTLNCANDHVPSAIHEMYNTYLDAGLLKEEAGIRKGGRPLENPVKHLSLNWHPDESPTQGQMIAAVEGYLDHMGWGEHQAMLAAHADKEHAHVHVMLNAVHPETGCKLDDGLERRRSSDWAREYEREHGRIYCEQRLDPVEEREPSPTRPTWMSMKEAKQAQLRIEAAQRAAAQAREDAEPAFMSQSDEWKALKAEQRAERTSFFEDGRQEFRTLRNAIFREVREEFREEWGDYYAARRAGTDVESLQAIRADLVALQGAMLKERRDSACAELRESRDGQYATLLANQADERAELTARQAVSDNALAGMRFDAANRNEPEPPRASETSAVAWDFRFAAAETTRAATLGEPNTDPSDSFAYEGPIPAADPRVRDPADIVAGVGLGMMGGAATIVERLLDGFFGGAPRPAAPANDEAPRPEPRRNPFAAHADEARRTAEREQEEAARDAWWDERRARARD